MDENVEQKPPKIIIKQMNRKIKIAEFSLEDSLSFTCVTNFTRELGQTKCKVEELSLHANNTSGILPVFTPTEF